MTLHKIELRQIVSGVMELFLLVGVAYLIFR
jgi:hypothetical protein